MRFPSLLGALAALVVGAIVIVLLLGTVLGQPTAVPTPGGPTAPPLATDTPLPSAEATGAVPSGPLAGESVPAFTQPPEGLAVGDRAPRIELPMLGGGTLDTAAIEGPLWINFMATWCPQCRDELPMMEGFQEQLGDELTLVLVDVKEDRQMVRQFIESLGVQLPTGIDEDGAVQSQWGAFALPKHFWVDGDGVVQAVLFGGAPRDLFIESIRAVVPEAEVE